MTDVRAKTFIEIVLELNNEGWRVGDLCQLSEEIWEARLVDPEGRIHEATSEFALFALQMAREAEATSHTGFPLASCGTQSKKLDLVALGLLKPKVRPPLDRRG